MKAAAGKPASAVSEVNTSEVFRQLTSTGRVHKVLPTRFGNDLIPIRYLVLTMSEVQKARNGTAKHFAELGITPTDDAHNGRLMAELLALACKEEKLGKVEATGKTFLRPIFTCPEDVEGLTDDQVVLLFQQYLVVKTEFAIPDESTIFSKEDLEVWLEALAKEANASFLAHLPLSQLARLTTMMAMEIQRSRSFPDSTWRDIGELREILSATNTMSSTELASDGTTEDEPNRMSLMASRNSFRSRGHAERQVAREHTGELLRKSIEYEEEE